MGETIINPDIKKTFPWKLVVIFLLFSAAIIIIGIYYYRYERNRIFEEQEKSLSAIASLKIKQISQWYSDKLADAVLIKDNEELTDRIKEFLKDENQNGIKKEITIWLEALNKQYDYNSVAILDTLLSVRLATSNVDPLADDSVSAELNNVIKYHKIIMTDLHKTGTSHAIRMDLLVPLLDPLSIEQKTIGLVILCVDPDKILFPLVQSWPTPSKSSETLILRREGDSVQYLNELRHRKNTALNLKLPLSNVNLLATKAVNGFEGVTEGIDYRNIPVIGALSKIPELPWFMVAKTDKKEILAPFKRYSFITVFVIVLLLLINASIFGFWIWQQKIKFYRNQLKNEVSLRESEMKFRQTFDLSPIGIVMVGLDKRFLRCNDSFSQSLGFKMKELAGKTIADVTHPEDIGIGLEDMASIARGEIETSHVQKRYLRKDGEIVWGDVLISLIRNNSGEPQYFLAIIQDITESKKIVEALRESEDKFKYIFDHSVIGKSITLPAGEINVNQSFCDMLGYTREELEKTKWQDISHPDDIKMTEKIVQSLISGEKKTARFIKRYLHKNGSVVWTDVGAALRRDNDGKPLYFMTAVINISDRKMAEAALYNLNEELEQRVTQRTEQLEAANKELEAFSYSVSHDLRAPLRSVHGYTKILMEEYENKFDEEGKRICGIISSSATQMGGLIDDLLSFSRIGRTSLNPSHLDMKSLVKSVFEEICPENRKSKTILKIGKLHKAFGDANLLKLVWTNLISNAIKYSSKENISEISVNSQLKYDRIAYSVKDNGVGFDMKYKHKLFGVFQRLHSDSEFEGNGVGLAIVQRLVLKHSGKVWAEGEEGKGATFYFSLPVQDKRQKYEIEGP